MFYETLLLTDITELPSGVYKCDKCDEISLDMKYDETSYENSNEIRHEKTKYKASVFSQANLCY